MRQKVYKDLLGFEYMVLPDPDMVSIVRMKETDEGNRERDDDWCGPLFSADDWHDIAARATANEPSKPHGAPGVPLDRFVPVCRGCGGTVVEENLMTGQYECANCRRHSNEPSKPRRAD